MKLFPTLKFLAATVALTLSANASYAQAFTENFDNITTLAPGGWSLQNTSSPVGSTGWSQGGTPFTAFNGTADQYISANYNNTGNTGTISNWLVTPMRVLRNGDIISFYTRQVAGGGYADRMELRMSTSGASTNVGTSAATVGDFTNLVLEVNPTQAEPGYPETWTQFSYTVTGLAAPIQGRFGLRYYVTGAGFSGTASDYMGIDNVVYTPNCAAITMAPATLSNATVGTAYNQAMTITQGFGTVSYTITAGALPPGLTLTTAGVLSGTPTATGTFNFSITAADASTCTKTTAYTIIVACPAVTINPATLPAATAGAVYTQNITLSGSTAVTINYTVTAGTLPTGINLTLAGVLGGAATTPGTYNFTITGTDQYGCSASRPYTLIVNCPVITVSPGTLSNGVIGTPYTGAVTSSGGIGAITLSILGAMPTGVTMDANGFITGTPTLPGTYNFTVVATDINNCTGQHAYTIIINCQTITIDQATIPGGTVNAAYAQTLTQTGGIGTGSYAITAGVLPAGITLSSAGVMSGTPTQSGTFNIDVTFTDANGCTDVQTYALVIACQSITIDQTTQPNGVSGVTYAGTAMTQTGGLGTSTFAVTSGALPAGVTLNTNGTFSGAPTVVGTFTFGITGSDVNSCTSNTQSFTINIVCANVSVDQSVIPDAYYNTPYSETLTQTGGVGTITYTMTGGTLPPGLTLSAAGVVSGTPTVGPGLYSIDVQAEDANGCTSAVQTISFGTQWPLAITLVDFTATSSANGNAVINWEAQNLEGTEQFFVEHSTDGRNFSTVTTQNAVKGQMKYTATHSKVSGAANYYRLGTKQQGGDVSYSKTVRIATTGGAVQQQAALLPNMIVDKATLKITANDAGKVQMRIVDMTGREVYKNNVSVNAGANDVVLDLHTLPTATYALQVIMSNGEVIPVKFIKM